MRRLRGSAAFSRRYVRDVPDDFARLPQTRHRRSLSTRPFLSSAVCVIIAADW